MRGPTDRTAVVTVWPLDRDFQSLLGCTLCGICLDMYNMVPPCAQSIPEPVKIRIVIVAKCEDVFGLDASRVWRLEGGLDAWFAWAELD